MKSPALLTDTEDAKGKTVERMAAVGSLIAVVFTDGTAIGFECSIAYDSVDIELLRSAYDSDYAVKGGLLTKEDADAKAALERESRERRSEEIERETLARLLKKYRGLPA